MNIKKIIHWGGPGGTVLIYSCKCNFSIYLDIQAISTLLCLLLVLDVLVPSIDSFFYNTTTLLKSDIFWHSKACSSHSFQPTGIRLGSLWRGSRRTCWNISAYLYIGKFFFYKFWKLFILSKNTHISKNFCKIYYSFFFFKKIYLGLPIYLLTALITSNLLCL